MIGNLWSVILKFIPDTVIPFNLGWSKHEEHEGVQEE